MGHPSNATRNIRRDEAIAGEPPWIARSKTGLVASDCLEASRIGAEVLEAGGNAFDAAVATSLALAVTRPFSTGLGGGGFLVAYSARERRFIALDFRETAPAAATPKRYANLHKNKGDGPSPSVYGGNAVAVPGQLAGLAEIRRRLGTKSWSELVAPAQELAGNGFPIDQAYQRACRAALADFAKWPQFKTRYDQLYTTLLGAGTPLEIGDTLKRPALARALQLIAQEGPDAFYRGPIATAIVKAVQAGGGKLTMGDLRNYRVIARRPIRAGYHQYEIIAMPPPSSGGVCVVETLGVLDCMAEIYPGGMSGFVDDNRYAPALVHAFKHAFADRAHWLGDPDFTRIPVTRLTSREYACELAAKRTPTSDDFGGPNLPDDGGTSHFCIADRFGNVVALTETINGLFGSLVVAEPFGIVLNNEMDDFLTVAGQANMFGLRQSNANLIGPGKRPLSSMSPTIVMKAGRPVLVLGASGGPRIITAVTQVILNVIEFGRPLEQAVAAIRLHHQWQPDEVYFDGPPPEKLVTALKNDNQNISDKRKRAAVQAIQFLDDGTLVGASDPRKGGRPVGAR